MVDLTSVSGPVELFVALWREASSWGISAIDQINLQKSLRITVSSYLLEDDGELAVRLIKAKLPTVYDLPGKAAVVSVLLAIDDVFSRIHPRSTVRSGGKASFVPDWLVRLAEFREHSGCYHDTAEGDRVIPRGPLTRNSRSADASSAYKFFDLFAFLEVVPSEIKLNGDRPISVTHFVLADDFSGTHLHSLIPSSGADRMVLVPLAESRDHLSVELHTHHSKNLIQFGSGVGLQPAQRMYCALKNSGGADFALAPELVMSESDVSILKELLRGDVLPYRLILAGSGPSADVSETGLPWNQMEVLNRFGHTLWKQQKLWLASIEREKAEKIVDPLKLFHAGVAYEANSEGEKLTICDVPGFGRCLVLICQDVLSDLAHEVVSRFQPDWIFVPILDSEVKEGGWVHRRLFELSTSSQARFVVLTSTSLPRGKAMTLPPKCLLLVSPMKPEDEDTVDDGRAPNRGFALHAVSHTTDPGVVVLSWHDAQWDKTCVKGTGSV